MQPFPPGSTTVLRGQILTMAETAAEQGTAVGVTDGKITSLHQSASAVPDRPGLRVLDFGARTILPGFIDGHSHIEVGAVAASGVDCRVPTVASIDEMLDSLHSRLPDAQARGGWLVGQGNLFLDQKLSDGRLPTRVDLDKVSKDVAIVIQAGGHVSCVNSKAIELARLDTFASAGSIMGGPVVERGSDGLPTGIIAELDAALPIPPVPEDHLRQVMRDGVRDLFLRYGVTHIAEISQTLAGIRALDALALSGELRSRVSLALWAPGTLPLADALRWREHIELHGDPALLDVMGIKIFVDGGFSAGTAAMASPYVGGHAGTDAPQGELAMSRGAIRSMIRQIRMAGLQPFVHTCGEYATQVVAEEAGDWAGEARLQVRAEHAGHLLVEREKTFDLMLRKHIRPMPNPAFLHTFGSSLPEYAGPLAKGNRFLFRDMLERGFRISGNSDLHVGSHPQQTNPFFMMWCSIARTGFDGTPVDPEQAIDVMSALRMHTSYAAEALGVDDQRGTIEVGKDADLIVLDRDPRRVPTDQLTTVNVDFVFVNGQGVYERDGAQRPYDVPR
jgi:predicted amidohydrolase YtcJ